MYSPSPPVSMAGLVQAVRPRMRIEAPHLLAQVEVIDPDLGASGVSSPRRAKGQAGVELAHQGHEVRIGMLTWCQRPSAEAVVFRRQEGVSTDPLSLTKSPRPNLCTSIGPSSKDFQAGCAASSTRRGQRGPLDPAAPEAQVRGFVDAVALQSLDDVIGCHLARWSHPTPRPRSTKASRSSMEVTR